MRKQQTLTLIELTLTLLEDSSSVTEWVIFKINNLAICHTGFSITTYLIANIVDHFGRLSQAFVKKIYVHKTVKFHEDD